VLTADTLDTEDGALIEAKTVEDRVLFARLMQVLDASDGTSITGRRFA